MCIKCLMAAMAGEMSAEMAGAPVDADKIKAQLNELAALLKPPTREEWLAKTTKQMRQSIEAQTMALAMLEGQDAKGRNIEAMNAVGNIEGDIILIVTYSSDEGDYWVDRLSKLKPETNASYETTSREAADQIAEDLYEALG